MGSGGDRQIQSGSEATGEQINALINGLPGLQQVLNEQILPSEQAQLAATQEIAPQIAQLQTELYNLYGPQLAQAAAGIEDASRTATAQSEANVLATIGPDIANAFMDIQGIIDPQFLDSRERISGQLAGIDVNPELSGADMAQLERYQNRVGQNRGLSSAPSNTRALESAINFADAGFNKRLQAANSLSQQASVLPSLRLNFDPTQATLGRPSIAPQVASNGLPGVQQQNIGDQAQSTGLSLLSEAGANTRTALQGNTQLEALRKDIWDKALAGSQIFGNVASGASSFAS